MVFSCLKGVQHSSAHCTFFTIRSKSTASRDITGMDTTKCFTTIKTYHLLSRALGKPDRSVINFSYSPFLVYENHYHRRIVVDSGKFRLTHLQRLLCLLVLDFHCFQLGNLSAQFRQFILELLFCLIFVFYWAPPNQDVVFPTLFNQKGHQPPPLFLTVLIPSIGFIFLSQYIKLCGVLHVGA